MNDSVDNTTYIFGNDQIGTLWLEIKYRLFF